MQTLKFKTNINCGGCIGAVAPALNNLPGVENWAVDTADPDKILTLTTNPEIAAGQILSVLCDKGFKAEALL